MAETSCDGSAQALAHEVRVLRQRVAELERQLGRFSAADDASEELKSVETLSVREALLLEAERIAHVGSWVWNIRTNEVAWSDELFRILGYDPATDVASAEAFFARVHPEDRQRVRDASTAIASSGVGMELRCRMLLPDGTVRHVSLDGALLHDQHGQLQRVVGTVLDMSEWIMLEQQVRQLQKLEALGRFSGGVAHDFNNLLTVILTNATLLRRRQDRVELREIEHAAQLGAALTKQLLTFSRQTATPTENSDLNELLRSTSLLITRVIGEDIEVHFDLDPGLRPARANAAHVQQILLNLASNARDAMPRGGRLTISTRNLRVPESSCPVRRPPGSYAVVTVRDTGSGMDEVTRQRAFEPFFTTKEPGRGTGLGLSLVFGAMAQCGGFVELSSAPGQGATFELYFPHARNDLQSPRRPRPGEPATGRGTILVVEDDDMVRRVLERVLDGAGYTALCFARPVQALGADLSHVELVVSDVVMPGMRGPELVSELRRRKPGLKALFVSGYAPDGALASLDPVLEARLQKPFEPSELVDAVTSMIRPGALGAKELRAKVGSASASRTPPRR